MPTYFYFFYLLINVTERLKVAVPGVFVWRRGVGITSERDGEAGNLSFKPIKKTNMDVDQAIFDTEKLREARGP